MKSPPKDINNESRFDLPNESRSSVKNASMTHYMAATADNSMEVGNTRPPAGSHYTEMMEQSDVQVKQRPKPKKKGNVQDNSQNCCSSCSIF